MSVDELEAEARLLLSQGVYDYFAGGAEDEATVMANRQAFDRYRFRYHVLTGITEPDPAVEVLGCPMSLPVFLAPTAVQRLAHPDGELASARAAASSGTVYCLSTLASTSLEDLAAASTAPKWFQLYIHPDRGFTRELVRRAADAGYRALVLTVDTPVLGRRERDPRNAFALPADVAYPNLQGHAPKTGQSEAGQSELARVAGLALDPHLAWSDLGWLARESHLPVVVKGVVRGDDALRCLAEGAAGLIVSNHGGRQLDHSIATLDALPDVVEAVHGEAPVMLDGGIRRGTDVLKALCLGASAVGIGRPYLWALATGAQTGVEALLAQLQDEIVTGMTLLGVGSVSDLGADLLSRN